MFKEVTGDVAIHKWFHIMLHIFGKRLCALSFFHSFLVYKCAEQYMTAMRGIAVWLKRTSPRRASGSCQDVMFSKASIETRSTRTFITISSITRTHWQNETEVQLRGAGVTKDSCNLHPLPPNKLHKTNKIYKGEEETGKGNLKGRCYKLSILPPNQQPL